MATDLETDALEHLDASNIEVMRHNILAEDLPQEAFDLVHTRFLLTHLPEREKALTRMVLAVRPGGWVVVGDMNLRVAAPARPSEVFSRVWAALLTTLSSAGADVGYGQSIPSSLEAQDLVDVEAIGELGYFRGGSPGSQLGTKSIERLRSQMVAADLVSDHDSDEFRCLLADPTFAWWTGSHWTGWGRKRERA